jgi:hypothetical protein
MTMPTVTPPPPQYDHGYSGPVIERILPLEEARKLCADIGITADGCSGIIQPSGACYIVLPSDGFDTVEAYRRHELAHCAGWPASHPPEQA